MAPIKFPKKAPSGKRLTWYIEIDRDASICSLRLHYFLPNFMWDDSSFANTGVLEQPLHYGLFVWQLAGRFGLKNEHLQEHFSIPKPQVCCFSFWTWVGEKKHPRWGNSALLTEGMNVSHLFLRILFSFFLPCPPHPSPGKFLPQNPVFLGPQICSV